MWVCKCIYLYDCMYTNKSHDLFDILCLFAFRILLIIDIFVNIFLKRNKNQHSARFGLSVWNCTPKSMMPVAGSKICTLIPYIYKYSSKYLYAYIFVHNQAVVVLHLRSHLKTNEIWWIRLGLMQDLIRKCICGPRGEQSPRVTEVFTQNNYILEFVYEYLLVFIFINNIIQILSFMWWIYSDIVSLWNYMETATALA